MALYAMLTENSTACSKIIWDEPQLRPNQGKALCHLFDPSKPRVLLVVDRTGSGKTHITRVAGVVEKGITLVIINLHSLSADQMSKFVGANQAYGTVEAHSVDEVYNLSRRKYNELLGRVKSLQRNTSSTLFLFFSPQFLCNHREFTNLLIAKAEERVLRLVVVDEVHLHVQQGTSFRSEIRQLKDVLFAKMFDKSQSKAERLL
jgi:superfamily II DNA helicase RecQ